MKKYIFLILATVTLSLDACSEKQVVTPENRTTFSSGVLETSETNSAISEVIEESLMSSAALEEEGKSLNTFIEQDKIFEVTDFSGTPEVAEDNTNKRIILWKEGEVVRYKSIYLKTKQTVKIIETGKEGQIYYGGL